MKWPQGMEPEHSAVYARNEIKIEADPAKVWSLLCKAASWPTWYSNCAWVKFENSPGPDLQPNTSFVWKTFGTRVRSTVRVFEPNRALEWDAKATGLRAYHGWLLDKTPEGVWVVTEETQNGPLPWLLRLYLRPMLYRGHQTWVEGLRRAAMSA